MAGEGNRWVVLLNRSPKGPLTEDEVRTLISKGMLRMNDIAYQVSEDGPKGDSEWKLLWQFPEFNRRQPGETAGKSEPTEPPNVNSPINERRKQKDPETVKKEMISELPAELLEIKPEALLPKTTQVLLEPEPDEIQPGTHPSEIQSSATDILRVPELVASSTKLRWVAGALVGGLILSYSTFRWLGKKGHSLQLDRVPSQNAEDPGPVVPSNSDFLGPPPSGDRQRMRPVGRVPARPLPDRPPAARPDEGYIPPKPEPEPRQEDPRDDRRDDREEEARKEEEEESKNRKPSEESSSDDGDDRGKNNSLTDPGEANGNSSSSSNGSSNSDDNGAD
jgi:hypothetical protein